MAIAFFYALAIGLKKQYPDKIVWDVNPQTLDKNLGKEALNAPASELRKKAAEYLEKNKSNEVVVYHSTKDIEEHNKDLNIDSLKSQIAELMKEIRRVEEIQQNQRTAQMTLELDQNRKILANLQADLLTAETKLIKNIEDYIAKSKESGFWSGYAQFHALSHSLKVPIRVIINYGTKNAFPITFSEETPPNGPIITVGYVNKNHFKYIPV